MRIGSAGKTFSLTGWKVGYVTAPAALAANVAKAHQNLTFTTAPNLQRAVAVGLGKDDAYFAALAGALQAKRDRLAAGLASLGLTVLPTQGQLLHHHRLPPAGLQRRRRGVLPPHHRAGQGHRDPGLGVLRWPRRPQPLRPLRVLQARRGAGRGGGAAAAAFRGAVRAEGRTSERQGSPLHLIMIRILGRRGICTIGAGLRNWREFRCPSPRLLHRGTGYRRGRFGITGVSWGCLAGFRLAG